MLDHRSRTGIPGLPHRVSRSRRPRRRIKPHRAPAEDAIVDAQPVPAGLRCQTPDRLLEILPDVAQLDDHRILLDRDFAELPAQDWLDAVRNALKVVPEDQPLRVSPHSTENIGCREYSAVVQRFQLEVPDIKTC